MSPITVMPRSLRNDLSIEGNISNVIHVQLLLRHPAVIFPSLYLTAPCGNMIEGNELVSVMAKTTSKYSIDCNILDLNEKKEEYKLI